MTNDLKKNKIFINVTKVKNYANWMIKSVPEIKDRIKSITTFNNALYISMQNGCLIKFDPNKNTKYLIETPYKNTDGVLTKFNNQLYLSSSLGKIIVINKNDEISNLDINLNYQTKAAVTFNNFLYIALESGQLYKIDKKNNAELVKLPISNISYIKDMAVFNNQLYCIRNDGIFFKIDQNDKYLEVMDLTNYNLTVLTVFKDYLYLVVWETHEIYKLNNKEEIINNIPFSGAIYTFVTWNDELYFSGLNTNYLLWKLDKKDNIINIESSFNVPYITKIINFNNELYMIPIIAKETNYLLKFTKK